MVGVPWQVCFLRMVVRVEVGWSDHDDIAFSMASSGEGAHRGCFGTYNSLISCLVLSFSLSSYQLARSQQIPIQLIFPSGNSSYLE
jgi:hypothetical protein